MTYHILRFFAVVVLCELSSSAEHENYKTTQFPVTGGLYAENLGTLRYEAGIWSILSTVDLGAVRVQQNETTQLVNLVDSLCRNISTDDSKNNNTIDVDLSKVIPSSGNRNSSLPAMCSHASQMAVTYLEDVRGKESLITQYYLTRRRKRGVLNTVGRTAKYLFGTLSDEDEARYNALFDLVTQSQERLTGLAQKHTTLFTTAFSALNHTTSTLRGEIANVSFALEANLAKIYTDINVQSYFFTLLQLATTSLTHLSIVYEQLLTVIVLAQHGIMHPSIINPKTLQSTLKYISSVLPPNTQLPWEPTTDNLHRYISFITPIVYFNQGKLQFVLRLPYLHTTPFELKHLIPVPKFISESTYIQFSVPNQFYAINFEHQQYFAVSPEILNSCEQFDNSEYVCSKFTPTPVNLASNCILSAFYKLSPQNCSTTVHRLTHSLFFELRQPNSWVYHTPKESPINARLHCKHPAVVQEINLVNTGIITISPNCSLHTNNKILYPNKYSLKTSSNFAALNISVPSINISIVTPHIASIPQHESYFSLDNLNPLQQFGRDVHDLELLTKTLTPPSTQRSPDSLAAAYGPFAVMLLTAILFTVVYKCRQRKSQRSLAPTIIQNQQTPSLSRVIIQSSSHLPSNSSLDRHSQDLN